MNDKRKIEWEDAHVVSTDGDVRVLIRRLPLREPKYSVKIGTLRRHRESGEEYLSPFISAGDLRAVVDAIKVAWQWVEEDRSWREAHLRVDDPVKNPNASGLGKYSREGKTRRKGGRERSARRKREKAAKERERVAALNRK